MSLNKKADVSLSKSAEEIGQRNTSLNKKGAGLLPQSDGILTQEDCNLNKNSLLFSNNSAEVIGLKTQYSSMAPPFSQNKIN